MYKPWTAFSRYSQTAMGSALIALAVNAGAQTIPDAGSILRQLEKPKPATSEIIQPAAPERAALPPDDSSPKAHISRFEFKGNSKIDSGHLRQALSEFEGKDLSLAQIKAAAAVIAKAYRDAGWVAAAFAPPQEVTDGVCLIEVLESTSSSILVKHASEADDHVPDALLIALARRALPEGEPISLGQLDRAILLAGDVPGVSVEGLLRSGEKEKSSSLELQAIPKPRWSGQVSLDNQGSRSTGSDRVQASINGASPFGLGDQGALALMVAQGVDYARVSYGFPMGGSGLRGSANASTMHYKLIGADFSALDASGNSQTQGFELVYPWIRGRLSNLNASLGTELRSFTNAGAGSTTSQYKMNSTALSLSGNHQNNEFGLPGTWSGSVGAVFGSVNLGGSANQAQDAAGPATAGSFSKLRWSLSRQQVLPGDLALSVSLSGQSASKNLDSSEKMQLGGFDGIRAYPSGEASGNDGMLGRVDLTKPFGNGFVASGFYDMGNIKQTHVAYAGMPKVDSGTLRGAGVALDWAGASGQSATLTYARRIGSNPFAQDNGADQDGRLVRNRVWLVAKWIL